MTGVVRFAADRGAYLRSHAWLAALAMAGAMAILWAFDNPHVWTGAVAGLAGIGVRGWYLAGEELAAAWELSDTSLRGPGERIVPLNQIAQVRTMGSFVHVITRSGDKHLVKYQADPAATKAQIERAAA